MQRAALADESGPELPEDGVHAKWDRPALERSASE
jgi:hypothetical protein